MDWLLQGPQTKHKVQEQVWTVPARHRLDEHDDILSLIIVHSTLVYDCRYVCAPPWGHLRWQETSRESSCPLQSATTQKESCMRIACTADDRNKQTNKQTTTQTKQTHIQTDRHTDRQTDKQTDRKDRPRNKQHPHRRRHTHTHTHTNVHICTHTHFTKEHKHTHTHIHTLSLTKTNTCTYMYTYTLKIKQ